MKNNAIYFGFFEDFKDPTVLFFGDIQGYSLFANLFDNYKDKKGATIDLATLDYFIPGKINIIIKILSKDTGMKHINENVFEWGLSKGKCEEFSDKLKRLTLESTGGVHEYLDCDSLDEVAVVASLGEYSVELFTDNGVDVWE